MTEAAADVAMAFLVNLKLAIIAQVLVLIFGLVLAVARLTPGKAGAPIRLSFRFSAVTSAPAFTATPRLAEK